MLLLAGAARNQCVRKPSLISGEETAELRWRGFPCKKGKLKEKTVHQTGVRSFLLTCLLLIDFVDIKGIPHHFADIFDFSFYNDDVTLG